MEVIRTLGGVMRSIKMLVDLLEKNKERGCTLKVSLNSIKHDLEFVLKVRAMREELQKQLTSAMQLQLQELAYDIDDFIQGLWVPKEPGSFILTAFGADSRPEIIQRVADFKDRIKNLKDELPNSFESIPGGGTSTLATAAAAGSSIPYAREVDLVGIKEPKKEIVELLYPRVESHLGRLSLIAMVGCSGSGKTALARALYEDDDVVSKFDYKAWLVASDPCSADLVNKICQNVVPTSSPPGNISKTLHHFQKGKRYLIFVDDVTRGTTCEGIKNALHENVMGSRIIVTTCVPSVAMECASGSFIYTMQGLDKENSRELFRQQFRGKAAYTEQDKHRLGDKDVDVIVDKCDGLPIALISAAECLRRKGQNPESRDFKQVSQELRDHLASCDSAFEEFQKQNGPEPTFAAMRSARVEPYENLLNHGEKECFLYGSIFPCGHQINSKNLVRRLIAEGLVPGDHDIVKASESVEGDVRECLRKLLNQHMVEPVPIRNYSNVAKRCRLHSIMLQFTLKRAVSRNFVSLIHRDQPLHSTTGLVRRLTVQSSPNVGITGPPEGIGLSVVRSVAIFDSGILNLQQCKLVRVLDLEGCHGLTRKDLRNICRLLFLKYLSLRNTGILELPKNVKKLMFLETLDTRDTRNSVVIKLPVEILMLPRLAYLFGKFELTNVHSNNSKKLNKFFSDKKSQLHTLGGIAVHETQSLEIVLLSVQHATKLKKVKVWYRDKPEPTPRARRQGQFTNRLKIFGLFSRQKLVPGEPFPCVGRLAETLKERSLGLESVSVDFNGVPNTFLYFLQINGTISSIKLHNGFGSLPGPGELGKVSNLKKLHLFSTGLESDELGTLQHLKCLQYLKLAEDGHGLWDSLFHVQVGGFISLIWLCFESSTSMHPPLKIDEGVKTPLNSLLLICEESDPIDPRVEGISNLGKLNEVKLHKSATDNEVALWKEEAKRHINMPYVEKQQV